MTKRQLFLIAGTIVLAACPGGSLAPCQVSDSNEDTGETFCPGVVTSDQAETPSPTVDVPEDPNQS